MVTVVEIAHGSEHYRQAVEVRMEVLRRPLGLIFDPEQLARESVDRHLVALDGDRVIGTLILTSLSPTVTKMRQVAVIPSRQGAGVGRAMVAFSEACAFRSGAERIELKARQSAVEFYERLGYVIEGEPFEEVGLPHRLMVKTLSRVSSDADRVPNS